MKTLAIGQAIEVRAFTDLEYVDDNKLAVRYECEPFRAVVTGKRRKVTGKYHPVSYEEGYYGEVDCIPAFLSPVSVNLFWEVRSSWLGHPILVRDEDLIEAERFSLPQMARRPARVIEAAAP